MKHRNKILTFLLFVCVFFGGTMYVGATPKGQNGLFAEAVPPVTTETTTEATTEADKLDAGEGEPSLYLDDKNIYTGMELSYGKGYIPTVSDNQVTVVFPILCEESIKGDCIKTALELGDAQIAPFVFKNYERTVPYESHKVNGGAGETKAYVADFVIDLKEKRINGSYPVILHVTARDTSGNVIEEQFTAYVTITDGITLEEETTTEAVEDVPTFAPKMMVEAYTYSKSEIYPGDEVTATITLKNTSQKSSVKNMTVTISAEEKGFTLLSKSDSVYVESIGAQETYTVSFRYRIGASVTSGQYDLSLAMDYADGDGNTYTASGKAKLDVIQDSQVEFDPLIMERDMVVSDVLEAKVQAMNLGRSKVYNVRAELSADGLCPQGTIFIGDMEAGSAASGTTQVSVSSLSGDRLYGETQCTVMYYYEDESGREFQETEEFVITIQSPFSETEPVEEESVGQWWIIMAVIFALILIGAVFFVLRHIIRKRTEEEKL